MAETGRIGSVPVTTTATRILPRTNRPQHVVVQAQSGTIAAISTDAGVTTANGYMVPVLASTPFVLPPDQELWAIATSSGRLGVIVFG